MSYDFDDDAADYRRLSKKISELEEEIDSVPFSLPGVSLGHSPDSFGTTGSNTGGSSTLAELTDVILSDPATNHLLQYKDARWKNTDHIELPSVNILADFILPNGSLSFDGTDVKIKSGNNFVNISNLFETSANLTATIVSEIANQIIKRGLQTANDVLTKITDGINDALNTGGAILQAISDATINFITDGVQYISDNVDAVVAVLRMKFNDIYEEVFDFVDKAWDWWEMSEDPIIVFLRDTIGGTIKNAIVSLSEFWENNIGGPFERGDSFLDGILRVIFGEVSNNGGTIENPTSTTSRSRTVIEWLIFVSDEIITAIFGVQTARVIINGIRSIGEFFSNVTLSELPQKIFDTVFNLGSQALDWLIGQADEIKTIIFGKITDALSFVNDIIVNFANLLIEGVGGLPIIGGTLASIMAGVRDQLIHKGDNNDIDLGSYDLQNVDRIFFNSDDAIDDTSQFPHISGSGVGGGNDMIFYAPTNASFGFNNGVNTIALINRTNFKTLTPLTVGLSHPDTWIENGMVRKEGNDIIFRANNADFRASMIGSSTDTDGTVIPPPTVIPNNVLRVVNGSSYATVSGGILDGLFGTELGSIGIYCNTNITNIQANQIILYIKNTDTWFGISFTNAAVSTRTIIGIPYGTSTEKKRVKFTTNDSDNSTLILVGNELGRIYTHEESSDTDDGSFGIVTSRGILKHIDYSSDSRRQTGSNASTTTIQTLINILPTIALSTITSLALDAQFGTGDGSFGFNVNSNKLFIKINGYWFTVQLET